MRALQAGVITVNGRTVDPLTILKNEDRIVNTVHVHEPAVTSSPVQVLVHDAEREFIVVNKPGSIPVHPIRQYYKNSLLEILRDETNFKQIFSVNRLDRLTSGLMFIALSPECASKLSDEFRAGTVKKEYVARVDGRFPSSDLVCDEPLLQFERYRGLNAAYCDPSGKPARTIFKLLRYDSNTNTSVVHCQPVTGRSHQIRVHLRHLGHPIANDWLYSDEGVKVRVTMEPIGGIPLVAEDEMHISTYAAQLTDEEIEHQYKLSQSFMTSDSLMNIGSKDWSPWQGHIIRAKAAADLSTNSATTLGQLLLQSAPPQPEAGPHLDVAPAHRFCPECGAHLREDPSPESLSIFLHALRYTTSLGTYETAMPEWAAEGFEWERGFWNGAL